MAETQHAGLWQVQIRRHVARNLVSMLQVGVDHTRLPSAGADTVVLGAWIARPFRLHTYQPASLAFSLLEVPISLKVAVKPIPALL